MKQIHNYSRSWFEGYFLSKGLAKFRATQVFEALYSKQVKSFDEISNINKEVKAMLASEFTFEELKIEKIQKSSDGTTKFLFKLTDGNLIETVLMVHDYGLSVCVTTQVGCNMGCRFCESGRLKKVRNLESSEMVEQILKIEAGKIERANDLKDERNQLIDELAQMGKIDVREDVDGNVLIQLEGQDFVSIDSYNEIGLHYNQLTGFATPYWTQLAEKSTVNGMEVIDISKAEVFDLSQDISTDINTDIGSLKAILLARGDERGTYKDLQVDSETYQKGVKKSVIMNVQAEFDQLLNKITTNPQKISESTNFFISHCLLVTLHHIGWVLGCCFP